MFSGLSTLRPKETKVAEKSEATKKLEAYLASKYAGGDGDGGGDAGKKKRKKKKKPASAAGGGILVMDEDVSGFSSVSAKPGPSELEGEDEDYQPIVVNEEGAQRAMRIVEQEKQRFESRADGSGWKSGGAPARGGRKRHDSPEGDISPPRRKRHDSPEGDLSSPRRTRHGSSEGDLSPPRRKRNDSPDEDLSPPRRKRQDSPDLSPPRRKRQDSPDLSPPRRKRQDSPDLSPPRRKRQDSPDLSPPRRKRQDSPDLSPPRRKRNDSPDGDLSPPRKKQAGATSSAAVVAKMSDGASAGMISGKALKDELEKKKHADQKRWKEMDASVSGRNADTVYRDKSGKRYTSKAEYMEAMEEQKKEKANKHVTEEELEWGGGMKQKKKKQAALEAMKKEAAKPFARRKDDAELDTMQKDVLRWGDPMAHLVTKRLPAAAEEVAPSLVNEKNKKAMKKSGFIVPQEVPKHSWIRRGLGAPPNRYGIKPGRHWDGVNRSNGFEEKMWKEQAKIRAKDTEAFMFLQSDM